jgi:Spy/CpxP family protein refolding chaperone
MKRLISLMVVALFTLPTIAMAGSGFKHGFKRMNPVIMKKVLKDAGCSDQQIRRIETIRDEAERKKVDLKHQVETLRLDIKQLMQVDNPDRAAIFKKIDQVGAVKLKLKKLWVGTILDVRKELTPEQWEQVQVLKAERMMKRRKHMRKRFRQSQPVQP